MLRRCGTLLEAHAPRAYGDPGPRLDPLLLGAAVQVWLNARRTAGELSGGLVVRTGPRTLNVAFTWPP
ncbi:hypothetical protein [Streptomyces sioyaensis]|uniref:hypothetical protein n=1 Tax=Streptomyces sioyaensis TaxID=67364 RepID=UPI0033D7EFB4